MQAPAGFKLGDFTGGMIPIAGVVLKNITITGVGDPTAHAITCVNVSGTSSEVTPPDVVCSQLRGA